jgi:hypothetical protein
MEQKACLWLTNKFSWKSCEVKKVEGNDALL